MQKYALKDNNIVFSTWPEKKYVIKLRDLAKEDKPREKLVKNGPSALSIQELLAIVLNTGTKREEVFSMVNRIFKAYGEKSIVSKLNPRILSKEMDIPIVKSCQIVACFELGRRFFKKPVGRRITIKTAKEVFDHLKIMRTLPKEQLRGLYLNSRYQLIHEEVISIGTLTATIIHPREVFRPALEYGAAAVILAHNHPSGSSSPTADDIKATRQIKEASDVLGIEFLDHIIISGNRFSCVSLDDE